MVKHFFICGFLTLIGLTLYSQDLIITTSGDTINCKITRISDEFIHYSTASDAETIRSRIQRDKVQSFIKAEAPKPEPVIVRKQDAEKATRKRSDNFDVFSDIRVAINSGYTYQFGGYDGAPSSYTKQVRSLWHIGGEAHYFTSQSFGIGIKFNRISTPAKQAVLGASMNIDEKIRFQYLAVSALNRQSGLGEKDVLYYGFALGRISYKDVGTVDGFRFVEEGTTLGISLELGYDYAFNHNLIIGLNAGVNLATLNDFTINGVNASTLIPDPTFNVSRLDFTMGFRYYR